jgi:hypothetical protein
MDEALDVPVASVENFSIPIEIQVCLVSSGVYFNAGSLLFAFSCPVTVTSAKGSCPPALPGKMPLAGACTKK